MGNFQSERQLIESFLQNNFTLTEIAWDNIAFDEKSVKEYISCFIRSGRKTPISLGGNSIAYEANGQLVISIYTKKGEGSDRNREIADSLESLFLPLQLGVGESITFNESEYITVGDTQEWYRGNFFLYYKWKKCI